ncbi:hypothetical protein ACFLWS_01675 [Chloroflexota bacterium]
MGGYQAASRHDLTTDERPEQLIGQAIKRETHEERMIVLKKRENDLLKIRSNLNPQVKIELDELERTMA